MENKSFTFLNWRICHYSCTTMIWRALLRCCLLWTSLREAFYYFSLQQSQSRRYYCCQVQIRIWWSNILVFSIIFSLDFSSVKDEMRKDDFLFQITSFAILFNLANFLAFSKVFFSLFWCVCFSIHECSLALTLVIFPLAAHGTKLFYKCDIKIVSSWSGFWIVIFFVLFFGIKQICRSNTQQFRHSSRFFRHNLGIISDRKDWCVCISVNYLTLFCLILECLQGNISEQNWFRQRKFKDLILVMCLLASVYKGCSSTSLQSICSSVSLLNMHT